MDIDGKVTERQTHTLALHIPAALPMRLYTRLFLLQRLELRQLRRYVPQHVVHRTGMLEQIVCAERRHHVPYRKRRYTCLWGPVNAKALSVMALPSLTSILVTWCSR